MRMEFCKCVFQRVMVFFIVCVVSGSVYAEIITDYVSFYDTGLTEKGEDLAVDGSGNVYVNVSTFDWSTYDYFTVKYDPSGNILWSQSFDSSDVDSDLNGVAVDPDNNVYVTGNSFNGINDDCLTIRYDQGSGYPLWEKVFDGGNKDTCNGITTDINGYIYVTGRHNITDTQYTYLLIKYDVEGNVICSNTTTMCDAPSECSAKDVAVDGSGSIYIAGTRHYGNYEITKYDSACQFVARWPVPPAPVAADIVADKQGYIYSVGRATGVNGEPDYLFVKYDSLGNEICQATYDGGGYDSSYGIALDKNKNIYVTGFSHNGSHDDILTVKYDSSCNEVWPVPLRWDGGALDHALGITLDKQRNIYVTGYTQKDMFDLFHDAVTIKFVCSNLPVRIDNPVPEYYLLVQDAYDNAGYGDVIQGQAGAFTEDLELDHNILVRFEGGCDCDYTSLTGLTTVEGDVTITNGLFIIQNGTLEIQ